MWTLCAAYLLMMKSLYNECKLIIYQANVLIQSLNLNRAVYGSEQHNIEVLCATYAAGGVKTESGMEGEGRESAIGPSPSNQSHQKAIFHQLFKAMLLL